MKPLTDTQTLILNNASKRTDGNIEPMPDNINAGIKPRVIEGLLKRELIEKKDQGYVISATGLKAIGQSANNDKAEIRDAINYLAAPREGTKLALIIAKLQQAQGASIAELQEATGWQAHTVRGTLATIKKRFNVIIDSTKDETGIRRYRIVGQNQSDSDHP